MKEEYAIVLDYLPNGYPLGENRIPIIQAVGEKNIVLLELVPKKGAEFHERERVYIGSGKREKISYISGRLKRELLTEASKSELKEFISKKVQENEKEFIDFFNKAQSINKKIHQLEILPGLGKKHMKEILKQREEKPFSSFKDLKERIPNLPDPKVIIEKRIFQELTEFERYNLLTNESK